MGSALFWDITQSMLLIPYSRFGPIFKDQEIQEETSVMNYHYTLRNIREESRSHILRGGSLESRIPTLGFQTSSLT